jgi:hypothetical protein
MRGRICSKTVKPSSKQCDQAKESTLFVDYSAEPAELLLVGGIQPPELKSPE